MARQCVAVEHTKRVEGQKLEKIVRGDNQAALATVGRLAGGRDGL